MISKYTKYEQFIIDFIIEYSEQKQIETNSSLIAAGLNSLLSQLLIAQIAQEFGVTITTLDYINYPTIEQLGKYIAKLNGEEIIEVETQKKSFKLTPVQEVYLTGRNDEIDWGGVPCQVYMENEVEQLDIKKFEQCLKQLMEIHSGLRTIILPDDTQEVLSEYSVPLHYQEIIGSEGDELLARTRCTMCDEMLDVSKPLFKVVVSKLPNKYRIHIQIDMICCDAMSIFIFWNDLMKLYYGQKLDEVSIDFIDYQENYNHEKRSKDKLYWQEKMQDFPAPPELPWNPQVQKHSKGAFKRHSTFIPLDKWNQFEKKMEKMGITPTVALMTLFSQTLSAFGAGSKFGLSVTTLGRDHTQKGIYHVVGDFTKILLFGVEIQKKSMLENALNVQKNLMQDLAYGDFTAVDIARELEREEYLIYPVVFTSLLGMNTLVGQESPFDQNQFSQSSTPQVLLDNQLLPTKDGVLICWDSVDKAFQEGMISKMFEVYCNLIEQAFNDQFWNQELRDLRTNQDKAIQNKVNQTVDQTIIQTSLVEGFWKQCQENPSNIAIIHLEKKYTYQDLEKRANQISHALQNNNITSGDLVMIQMEKSFDLIATILGIVQIGAIYVPMPHDQPIDRQLDIYHKAKAKCIVVLNNHNIASEIPKIMLQDTLCNEGIWHKTTIDPQQLAYVIYTSGSTGTPKGVAISHDAAMNTIIDVNKHLDLSSNDCLIGLSSVSFDLSVYDIFGSLSVGAALVVPSEEERIDPTKWISLCTQNQVTRWNTVPALFEVLLDYAIETNKTPLNLTIKSAILSGDWIPMNLFDKMKIVLPNTHLISMGGATEASIWSNYYHVNKIQLDWVSIPYGFPLANQKFYVLDDFDRLCPSGVSGKLHIGGRGVASGYYNDEKLTNEAFFIHQDTQERLYNTGDYGRYDEDGCLIFMGRKDTQVKINGYRIELGEIQSALDQIGYHDNTVIVSGHEGSKTLIAFVKDNDQINESEVKKLLLTKLPNYFIPDRVLALSKFPITANGKVDQKKLLEIYIASKNNLNEIKSNIVLTKEDLSVLELIKQELNIDNITIDSNIMGLGINSLTLIRLSSKLEAKFGHRAKINDIINYKTIGDFITYYQTTNLADIEKKIQLENLQQLQEKAKLEKKDPFFNHPVIVAIKEELQILSIRPNDELNNLGLSSLSVIRVANKLESIYGIRPTVQQMLHYTTIQDLMDFYESDEAKQQIIEVEEVEILVDHPVLRCICEVVGLATIEENQEMASLGITSLAVIRIANKLENHYGVRPSVHQMLRYVTIKDLVDFYEQSQQIQRDEVAPIEIEVENPVLRCICEVIGMSKIAGEDSFASLGISSLEVIRVSNLLEARFGKRPTMQEIVEQNSFNDLIAYYEGSTIKEQVQTQEDLERKNIISLYYRCKDADIILWPENGKLRFKAPKGALSPSLKQELSTNKDAMLRFLESKDSITGQDITPLQMAYVVGRQNQYILGDITAHYYVEYNVDKIDLDVLQDAINELIVRNEILRTIITPEGRMNVYTSNPGYTIETTNCLEGRPIRNFRDEMKDHQFELGKWPMFDVKVTNYSDGTHGIHIGIDCLILDGWSINMFLQQLIMAYTGIPFDVTDYSFRVYLEEERQWLRNKQYYRDAQKYWSEQIHKLPPAPHIPFKTPLEEIKKPQFKRKEFLLSAKNTFAFFRILKKYDLTPSSALCSAYMMSLSKYSTTPDVTLNLTMFNRHPIHPDIQQVLGDFTNIALVGRKAGKNRNFLEEVAPVSQELWNAIEYRSYNVINLLGQLAQNYNDVIAAPFVFTSLIDNIEENSDDLMKKAGFVEVFAQTQTPQVVLDHQLYIKNGQLLLVLDYVEQAFDDQMLSEMFKDYTDRITRLSLNENWEEIYE